MMRIRVLSLLALLLAMPLAWAQEFEFHPPPSPEDAATPATMRDLAERALPVYSEPDTDRYLTNLAALQLVAGDYAAAYDTRQMLQGRRRSTDVGRPVDKAVLYDIYARARAIETTDHTQFPVAFAQAFKEVVPRLNDRDAHAVSQWLGTPREVYQAALQKAFDRYRAEPRITFTQAVDLVWLYLAYDAYRNFSPLVQALDAEDETRRYVSEEVTIKTQGGVPLHATVTRPAKADAPLTTLLEFTIDTTRGEARAAAAHGYAGVVAYTRGSRQPGARTVTPFLHDGEDVRAVIAWIAAQPWSDGRVGLYGNGYSGFAAWASTRRGLPPALKAIATASAMAPGVDFPMSGNVFRSSAFRWSATNTQPGLAAGQRPDDAQWAALQQQWYRSGRAYRDFDRRYARPDAVVRSWLAHPSYDAFWRRRGPYGQQFARIDVPVLTIAGYYAAGAPGALYYYREHLRQRPDADHTLLAGPFDDRPPRDGAPESVRGLPLDSSARVDLAELRYQWFDHVLKGADRPALLKDRVNLQLVGANEWRHAPSLDALAEGRLRFYLNPGDAADAHRLTQPLLSATDAIEQVVKLGDRSDAQWAPSQRLVERRLPLHESLVFVSDPLPQAVELAGRVTGWLDFNPNKQDFDFNVTLYEQLANGVYVQLADADEFRASYLRERERRHLLRAGERQVLPWASGRLASRRIAAGSRVVLLLGINKRADRPVNAGTGKDVKAETAADARVPLRVRWYASSFVELPVRR